MADIFTLIRGKLSLFASELLHALGSAINIKWVAQGTVSCSPICTTQGSFKAARTHFASEKFVLGVLQLVGTTGVALATLESIYMYMYLRDDDTHLWISGNCCAYVLYYFFPEGPTSNPTRNYRCMRYLALSHYLCCRW